jgi:hypothetical protein
MLKVESTLLNIEFATWNCREIPIKVQIIPQKENLF